MEREYFSIHGYNPLRLDVDEETGWRCELPCSPWVGGMCEGWLEGQAVWGPAGARGSAEAFGFSLSQWHSFAPSAGKRLQQPSWASSWDLRPCQSWGESVIGDSSKFRVIASPVSAKSSLCSFPPVASPLGTGWGLWPRSQDCCLRETWQPFHTATFTGAFSWVGL